MAKKLKIQSTFQRFEKKYLLTSAQYTALLDGMKPYLQPDEYGRYTICNLYYDTDNYQLIRTSLEKPVYKEKLRLRSYGVPGDGDNVFVELKKKFHGVVYKRRVVMEVSEAMAYLSGTARPSQEGQICHEIDWFLASYHPTPKVFIAYDREALAGREDPELRVTFDTNLRWRGSELDLRRGDGGERFLPEDQILMEIKIPGAAPVWLGRLLSETGIFPTSFSKYGTCYRQNLVGQHPEQMKKEAPFCA
ncbi:MAG: polyphosphate polymerase domain-containing protein [Oscillospiraceae bacterium]